MNYKNTLEFARKLDQKDPLKKYREEFHIPLHKNKEVIYMSGNSLGLQPKKVKQYVNQELEDWAKTNGVRRPIVPKECQHNAHLYYLLLPNETTRDRFIERIQANGISAIFHYQPLHASEMGRSLGYAQGDLPVSEDVSTRIVRLPFFYDFSSEQQSTVINAVKAFVC